MNWTAISAVADVCAALAVLVTLIYLAIQLRQAKEQIELSSQRHRADAAREVLASISDSPYLAPILAKIGGFPWGDFRMHSPEQRATQEQLLKGWLSVPWAAQFWVENRAIYDADFAAMVDTLLSDVVASGQETAAIFSNRGGA